MRKLARPGVVIAALALAGGTVLAACGGGSSSGAPSTAVGGAFGTLPPAASGAQHTGTITWAEAPGTAPTWILPLTTSAAYSVNDTSQFSYEMWRPLYWFTNGVEPSLVPAMSMANAPVWSNGDKTVSVTMKSNFKWSDGQPVTSKDVQFFFDEVVASIKESPANWDRTRPGSGSRTRLRASRRRIPARWCST